MSGNVTEAYLADLAALLPGPAGTRAAIIAEISGGLEDAVDDHLSRGLPPEQAARLAIVEFGEPATIAAEFIPVVAAAQVHRHALAFVATGPVVGALWLATGAYAAGFPIVAMGVAVAIAASCAMFAVAATGKASRWLPVRLTTAVTAVRVTAGSAVVVDLAMLTVLGSFVAAATVPVALAALASTTRLGLAIRSTRMLRNTHASLTS